MPATPSPSQPAGDDRNLVAVDPLNAVTFAEKLELFWKKNRTGVLAICGLIVLGVIAKGVWEYLEQQKELEIEKAYAAASNPEQLKAFAAAHPNHSLAAVAQLQMADDAYTAGQFGDAIAGYDKVLGIVKTGPLAARVQLGRGVAKLQGGKAAEGTAELKQLVNDANQFRAIRTEAAYQLASFAAEANNSAEVQKLSDQLMQIDPSSAWTQRALVLRAALPVEATPAAPMAPGASAPAAAAKKEEAGPSVQIKLPGK